MAGQRQERRQVSIASGKRAVHSRWFPLFSDSMSRKSCSTFSIPTCSNSLILSESLSIKWFHLIGTRSKGGRDARTQRRSAVHRSLPEPTLQRRNSNEATHR